MLDDADKTKPEIMTEFSDRLLRGPVTILTELL
jgi:hypothetical protein